MNNISTASKTEKTGNTTPLLSVRGLCKYFPIKSKGFFKKQIGQVRAVDNLNFHVMPGETLGLVGESGCGKTTAGRTILRALDPTAGEVLFQAEKFDEGQKAYYEKKKKKGTNGKEVSEFAKSSSSATYQVDLAQLSEKELKPLRTQMQMIFQDPFASLNPRITVRDIIGESLSIHKIAEGSEYEDRVSEILQKVGLKPEHRTRYPHAFSGGQRQRIGIARALIMNPSLVVCDEAVSALDVSVQAQVINLLQQLQADLGLTYIFIAHDLSVVKHLCDRIAVMYAGKIVELATTQLLFENPMHPYSQALLSAVPNPDPDQPMNMNLSGEVADPGNLPPGCAFNPRCQMCIEPCDKSVPDLIEMPDGRQVACHRYP